MSQSLTEFLKEKNVDLSLSELLHNVLAPCFIKIRQEIETSKGGFAGTNNASGESQLTLDIAANSIMVNALTASPLVYSLASEELETIIKASEKGKFSVAFDPLDGSSLVDANLAVGTIFGVYPHGEFIGQRGRDQLATGIAVYGPKTLMLIAVSGDSGVHLFEWSKNEWIHISGPILIAPDAKYFAPGNVRAAKDKHLYLQLINDWISRGLTLRYSGGMVPDIAHIFIKGSGIFSYPGYSEAPLGKLRLLFECNPISFLIEAAGGNSLNGLLPILNLEIQELHQRTPIFCGSKNEVDAATRILAG